ncbi:gp531 [Bacillus phage G]|uniref:Gp531 n=1 Tax=Bacillus phage G TaxID=2884420 RepID=G3MAS2_9CAUD|nr:gp531 [Bacillus phage G]AEO93789.1 gp531 [Bacillus phage G]
MKRLLKTSSGTKRVYHGTSLENFMQIASSGKLISNPGEGVGSWNAGHVYLGTEYGVASIHGYGAAQRYYDEFDGGPPYVVLEFEIDESRLVTDPDNNPECGSWQESAAKNGQVAVEGEIDLPASTTVHFMGGEEWSLDLATELGNWESFYEQHKQDLLVPGEEDY